MTWTALWRIRGGRGSTSAVAEDSQTWRRVEVGGGREKEREREDEVAQNKWSLGKRDIKIFTAKALHSALSLQHCGLFSFGKFSDRLGFLQGADAIC
jgi:hypothetical protein